MAFLEFINKWIVKPWFEDEHYNIVDTTVYALLFVAGVLLVYKMLQKMKIKIDIPFVAGWSGWIFAAASIRVLEDIGVYKSIWAVTPGLAMIIASAALFTLVVSKYIEKKTKINYLKIWIPSGFSLALINLARIPFVNPSGLMYFVLIFAGIYLVFRYIQGYFPKILTDINLIVLMSQFFDATATFVGIYFFGFVEKHILPTFLISIFGPAVMFPLKLIVVAAALYAVDTLSESEYEARYLKLVIFTLGFITGLRDLLQIISF